MISVYVILTMLNKRVFLKNNSKVQQSIRKNKYKSDLSKKKKKINFNILLYWVT